MELKYINSGGVKIACRKYGAGKPVIFLHGNGENSLLFEGLAGRLAEEGFCVYAPDARSHGLSGKVKRLHYADMADDIMSLINEEGLTAVKEEEKPVLFGFSDGGITALLFASKYPNVLDRLLVAGVNLCPNGLLPWLRNLDKIGFFFTRSDKLRLMLKEPNIQEEQLKMISVSTVVFHAERDIVKHSQSETVARCVQHGNLIDVPRESHGSYIADNEKLYGLIRPYLTDNTENNK